MKRILLGATLCALTTSTFAGGLLTNTNQHISFLRNPARDAVIAIDGLYSNPAGIAFMKDGVHLSLNNQSAFQTRTINTTFAPFAMNGGDPTKKYVGKASAPVVPSVFAVYKKDRWAFGGHIAITGGGGKATFNDGLGSFESEIAVLPGLIKTSQYSADLYMQGKQMIYGIQLGAAYRITDYLSAYAGVRTNIVSNSYIGHIKDIQSNIDGEMQNVNTNFSNKAAELNAAAAIFEANGNFEQAEQMRALAGAATLVADATADKYLDCDQSGWGVTPIIGLDFKYGKLNVGVKYEFITKLNIENKTKVDDTGLFKHGVNTPNDIPAYFAAGAQYELLPTLRASVGYHHFFDKQAKMANDKQKYIEKGTNEYLAGIEYDLLPYLTLSIGGQRTKYGIGDGYQSDMSFSCSSYSVGGGMAIHLKENLQVNIAYFHTLYDKYTKNSEKTVGGKAMAYNDVFNRTNKVFGIGVDYNF